MTTSTRRLVLVLLGVALALGCAELIFRVASPIRAEQLLPRPYRRADLQRIAAGETYVQFDRDLGWSVKPATVQAAGPVVYQSNDAGLRSGREYAPEPPPGVRRIAAFGDSFTHCDEVDNPDCWSARLEAAVPDLEVLNYGVPGSAPDQAWLRYGREGAAYQPCAVLIGFMPENIHRVVNRFRPFYQPETGITLSKPRFVLEGGGLVLLPNPARRPEDLADVAWVERELGPRDHWYYPGLFAASPLDWLYPARLARTSAYRLHASAPEFAANAEEGLRWAYESRGEAFEITGRVLIQFARQVERDGRTPIVVVFGREPDVVAKRHGEDRIYEPLVERLQVAGVATVDVTDALAREARRGGVESLIDKHYRPRGNQVVADLLAQRLPELTRATCR